VREEEEEEEFFNHYKNDLLEDEDERLYLHLEKEEAELNTQACAREGLLVEELRFCG